MKYYLLPLGCQMNLSDTERVRTVLNGMGFVETDDENEATILGIIACSVRQKGIDKVYGRIEKWNAMKHRTSSSPSCRAACCPPSACVSSSSSTSSSP